MINLVTGLGRCGTSLAMQMLEAGGAPVVGKAPWYEPPPTVPENYSPKWLARQEGKFVKLINPKQFEYPEAEYRILWLTRDPMQQVMSIIKLQIAQTNRRYTGTLEQGVANLKNNERGTRRFLERLGSGMHMKFEDIIAEPMDAAERIARHFSLEAEIATMAAVVWDRNTSVASEMEHA